MYPFGDNGTLAWTTPAGGLLSVASCIRNRLLGVEFKRSIQTGLKRDDRAKSFNVAANSRPGTRNDIGISLEGEIKLLDVSWVQNRWPRYSYQVGHLDIRLQYYIHSQTVIQQYTIRNNRQEDEDLAYVISSDLSFVEHKSGLDSLYPVPTSRSSNRSLLFENSVVLLRNAAEKVQMKMAIFLNGQRKKAWAGEALGIRREEISEENDSEGPDGTLKKAEKMLRDSIDAGKSLTSQAACKYDSICGRYYEHNAPRGLYQAYDDKYDFGQYRSKICVPGQSTQEFCAMIQVLDLPILQEGPTSALSRSFDLENHISTVHKGAKDTDQSLSGWLTLSHELRALQLDTLDAVQSNKALNLLEKHLSSGESAEKSERIDKAQYHYHVASLIAKSSFDHQRLFRIKIQFKYAQVLDDNFRGSAALTLVKKLFQELSTKHFEAVDVTNLWILVLSRLASMYLDKMDFVNVEGLFKQAISRVSQGATGDEFNLARFLERNAWTQVYQRKYKEADSTYSRLSSLHGITYHQQRMIFSNRGFIKRRLGQFAQALSHYESALDTPSCGFRELCSHFTASGNKSHPSMADFLYSGEVLYRLSGLFTCLVKLAGDFENNRAISAFTVRYIDGNAALFSLPHPGFRSLEDPLQFAITRQLETLLSTSSIPVDGKGGLSGIAFVDANPLNCIYNGRCA